LVSPPAQLVVYPANYIYEASIDEEDHPNGVMAFAYDVTDHVVARRAAERSESRLKSITEAMPQLVWQTDPQGNATGFNQRWATATGTRLEENLGDCWMHALHTDDLPLTLSLWQAALQSKNVYSCEHRLRMADGAYRWHVSRAVPIFDNTGEIAEWIGTTTDIDDQKTAEALREASEARFRQLANSVDQIIWTAEPDGILDYYNERWYEFTGFSRGEIGDQSWTPILHPDDVEPCLNTWYNSVQTGKPYHIEYRFKEHDSTQFRWFLGRALPVRDEHGNITKWFGSCTDIDRQKRAEQELMEVNQRIEAEKRKLEAIFVDSPASMALLRGTHFIFEKVNPNCIELVGGRELIGKSLHDALPELVDQPFLMLMKNVYATGVPFVAREMLTRLIRHPGRAPEETYLDVTYTRVEDIELKPYGIYLHAINVTDKVLARQRIENLAEGLREAVLARDEFLSIASHELKTPLTSLKLQAQIFQRASKKGDSRLYEKDRVDAIITQTEKQVARLTRLIDDMLDVSRIRSDKLTLEKEYFCFCDLVKEVCERMSQQFAEANYASPIITLCDDSYGEWDRMRIEQVLTNLLTNAIRYGNRGPVLVRVENKNDTIYLSVKDNGIGISLEAKEKIFDRFERAIDANEVSGLGLGLFITHQIVKAHGGKIWVESELNKGSTFFVAFPKGSSSILPNEDH
jgi:PAS domain S-box-containing protein